MFFEISKSSVSDEILFGSNESDNEFDNIKSDRK